MERKRYGMWAGNSAGVIEDMTCCTEEVYPTEGFGIPHQCNRKRGYGANGLYCKQHARMAERKLTKYAPDVAPVTSAEPLSGLESVPAVESDTQPRG